MRHSLIHFINKTTCNSIGVIAPRQRIRLFKIEREIKSKMKLLTFNFLTSKCIKGVKVGYPLILHITSKTEVEAEYNAEFLTKLLPRLDWPTMCAGADMVGSKNELPAELNEQHTSGADEAFLKKLHHILLEIDILEGHLECPETGRQFPISNGIPNMLLNEDEV